MKQSYDSQLTQVGSREIEANILFLFLISEFLHNTTTCFFYSHHLLLSYLCCCSQSSCFHPLLNHKIVSVFHLSSLRLSHVFPKYVRMKNLKQHVEWQKNGGENEGMKRIFLELSSSPTLYHSENQFLYSSRFYFTTEYSWLCFSCCPDNDFQ